MQYTQLGRTGLKVSRLCLGCMNYGPHTSEAEAHAQMDKAHELGINFFDTADVYGWKRGEGVTEQIIGNFFAKGGGRRERTILATKVFGDMNLDELDHTMKRGLSAVKIRRACEGSLRRLKTDYIDLYQMHHIARECPWDEIWQAMETLVQQGKIIYVGSSNFPGWCIAAACETARQRHFLGLVSEQCKFSLACRFSELEVLPAAQKYGLAVIPWSPLDGGILGGILSRQDKGRTAGKMAQERLARLRPQVEAFEAFCREIGHPPGEVALAWTLHHPAVTAPIIGPRTMEQLLGCVRALELKLDESQLRALDRIFPGPKGPTAEGISDWSKQVAPEAYAW
ncbi:MAG: aldo/keto reductase [Phycisphaerae bacterium]|nr:aldo/keto reductase [Phycisphaerae bacterium]